MNGGLVLAADVGGTKTRLALVPALGRGRIGDPSAETSVASADFPSLEALLEDFRASHRARIAAVSPM
jgi:glucokinase